MLRDDKNRTGLPEIPLVFLDVDTQKDFMLPEGRLSIHGAGSISQNLAKLSEYAAENNVLWLATMDSHESQDVEISSTPDFQATFPPHCMAGSEGEERIPETERGNPLVLGFQSQSLDKPWSHLADNYDGLIFKKNSVDVFSNPNFDRILSFIRPQVFVVFGVATDFCVKYAIQGLLARNFRIALVKDAIYSIDKDVGRQLVQDWESQGVKLMTTGQVINLIPNQFEKIFDR